MNTTIYTYMYTYMCVHIVAYMFRYIHIYICVQVYMMCVLCVHYVASRMTLRLESLSYTLMHNCHREENEWKSLPKTYSKAAGNLH